MENSKHKEKEKTWFDKGSDEPLKQRNERSERMIKWGRHNHRKRRVVETNVMYGTETHPSASLTASQT